MTTFKDFLFTESDGTKESAVESFVKLFKKYEFFEEVENFKTSPTRVTFTLDDVKFKVELSLGEVEVTKDGKKVYSNEFDEVEQSLVDCIVDAIDPKLKDSKHKP